MNNVHSIVYNAKRNWIETNICISSMIEKNFISTSWQSFKMILKEIHDDYFHSFSFLQLIFRVNWLRIICVFLLLFFFSKTTPQQIYLVTKHVKGYVVSFDGRAIATTTSFHYYFYLVQPIMDHTMMMNLMKSILPECVGSSSLPEPVIRRIGTLPPL